MTKYICNETACTFSSWYPAIEPETYHMWDILAIIGGLSIVCIIVFAAIAIWEWVENVNYLRKRVSNLESSKPKRRTR